MEDYLKSNIVGKETTKEQISKSLSFISDRLASTLGPYGGPTIIQDRHLQHFMSKDGYTVLKNMYFDDDIPRTVLDIIKRISKTLVRTVGDGSTSSVIIADNLFTTINDILDEYSLAAKDMENVLDIVCVELSTMISNLSTHITSDNQDEILTKIASISTNNDNESGKFICKLFNEIGVHGKVSIEKSKREETYYNLTSGTEIKRGYIEPVYATEADKTTCKYENVNIFMCNDTMQDDDMDMVADLLNDVCIQKDEPLIFIAKDYSHSMKSLFFANKMRYKKLPLVVIDISLASNDSRNRFDDIAFLTSSVPFNKREGEELENGKFDINRLGYCAKIEVNETTSKLIDGDVDEKSVTERTDSLIKLLRELEVRNDHIDRENQIYELKRRIAVLSGSMAVVYVGGNTEAEKETKKFLVEDAVYACQSALEYGYVVGGNLSIPRILSDDKNFNSIINTLKEELSYMSNRKNFDINKFCNGVLSSIKHSFEYAYSKVLSNANLSEDDIVEIIEGCTNNDFIYNLKMHKYENDDVTMVINSVQTDIEILKATFSLIGLLATSNQFLTINTN